MPKRTPLLKKPKARHFIKAWRLHRGLTLNQLGERSGISTGNLSRIENGHQDYNERILERLAEALGTTPASLIMRNPNAPEAIWSLWDAAKPAEKRQIEELARIVVKKTGS